MIQILDGLLHYLLEVAEGADLVGPKVLTDGSR
jgi:hypothetical protein